MTNPTAYVVLLFAIVLLATLAVLLSRLLPGWLIVVGVLVAGGVVGYLIAPPRRK
jgi:hypothetical protein